MSVASFEAQAAQVPSFRDLQSEFMPVRDVNAQQARSLSRLEQLAVWITDRVGSMGFFLLIAAWTAIWLAWNTLAPPAMRFDPAPAFAVWLFVSNLLQLHLMPLIMVGQNLEERHDQLRAQADFEISLKAEAEIQAVLQHLVNQNALMFEMLRRIEHLEQSTDRASR
jgi:uncharacterized membrane protein